MVECRMRAEHEYQADLAHLKYAGVSIVLAPNRSLQERLAAGELLQRPRHVIHIRQSAFSLGPLGSCTMLGGQGRFAPDLAKRILVVFPANGRKLRVLLKECLAFT